MADSPSRPPVPFNLTSLPPEVAREIAGYIRSAVFVPLVRIVQISPPNRHNLKADEF